MATDFRRLGRRVYEKVRRGVLGSRDTVRTPDQPYSFCIDSFSRIDPSAYYLRGWMWDPERRVTGLIARSPEGQQVDVLPRLHRYERPDVATFVNVDTDGRDPHRLGLIGLVSLASPTMGHGMGWSFRLVTADGRHVSATVGVAEPDAVQHRHSILAELESVTPVSDGFLREHVHPAVTRLGRRIQSEAEVADLLGHGAPASAPAVSIVVPLYRRIHFLEQQLAHFANDPEARAADIVYVLDSPEHAETLRALAPRLYELYRVPFRLALLARNCGFARANNAGAELAQGRLLLLLNSDVIPDRPGWLGSLIRAYDSTPSVGALGPKLLYEDDSIQHAGMYFRRLPGIPEWSNEHYHKGYHRAFGPASLSRPVPAVTGACLLMDRALYRDLGGLRGEFVLGDYEDSDLCLRALEAGRHSWYQASVELYHLEAQSYTGPGRHAASRYNRWLHTQHWDERIGRLMAQYGSAS